MRRFKAFSLLELLVAMAIGSIVIATGYSIYEEAYKQFHAFQQTRKKLLDVVAFKNILENDFQDSDSIIGVDEGVFEFSKAHEKINYEYREIGVIRSVGEKKDTFALSSSGLLIEYYELKEEKKIVKNMVLDVILFEEKQHLEFSKDYSAKNLIDIEIETILNEKN